MSTTSWRLPEIKFENALVKGCILCINKDFFGS